MKRLILRLAVMALAPVCVVAGDDDFRIVHISGDTLAWQLNATNGYCGVQFCEALGKEWSPVTNGWNLPVQPAQKIMAVSLAELNLNSSKHDTMFFRIVWSQTSLQMMTPREGASTAPNNEMPGSEKNRNDSLSTSPAFVVDVRSFSSAKVFFGQDGTNTVTISDFPSWTGRIRELFSGYGIEIREAEGPKRPHEYPPFNEGQLTLEHSGGNEQAPFSGTFLCGQSPNGLIFSFKTPVSFFGFATIGNIRFSYPALSVVAYDSSGKMLASYETSRFPAKHTFSKVSSDAEYVGLIADSCGIASVHVKPVPPYGDANIEYFVMDTISVRFIREKQL